LRDNRRPIRFDAKVTVRRNPYEVEAGLASEEVVVRWGLVDQELYLEHDDKRFSPTGGPIPPPEARGEERADRTCRTGAKRPSLQSLAYPKIAAKLAEDRAFMNSLATETL
jgi:hypothetical protein